MVDVLKRRDAHLHNALVGAAVPDRDVIYKNHDDAKITKTRGGKASDALLCHRVDLRLVHLWLA